MTFLKLVLATLMFSVTIIASVIILGGTKEKPKTETEYILRYENGQVFLFKDGEIYENFEGISFNDLPFVDQENLKAGIKMNSYQDVLSLVEDFDG